MTAKHQLLHYECLALLSDADYHLKEMQWWRDQHYTLDNQDLKKWAEDKYQDHAAKRMELLSKYADKLKQLVEPSMPELCQ